MQFVRRRHGKSCGASVLSLYFAFWGDTPLELDLALGAQRNWPRRPGTAIFLPALLVSSHLAGYVKLGQPEPSRSGAFDLHYRAVDDYRRHSGQLPRGPARLP